MKKQYLYTVTIMFMIIYTYAQNDSLKSSATYKNKFTIEPGIGISPMPIVDMSLTNIVQWGIAKRFSVISYTSLKENNLFKRNFNYIKGTNNHTISQSFGVGTTFCSKHADHTFSMLAGIKYTTYTETMSNPQFEKVQVSISEWNPDAGLMYNLKLGRKRFFFSYRMYIPLAPYPMLSRDFSSVDGNIANISLEAGLGIRLN